MAVIWLLCQGHAEWRFGHCFRVGLAVGKDLSSQMPEQITSSCSNTPMLSGYDQWWRSEWGNGFSKGAVCLCSRRAHCVKDMLTNVRKVMRIDISFQKLKAIIIWLNR